MRKLPIGMKILDEKKKKKNETKQYFDSANAWRVFMFDRVVFFALALINLCQQHSTRSNRFFFSFILLFIRRVAVAFALLFREYAVSSISRFS